MKSILKIKVVGLDYYTSKRVTLKKTVTCEGKNFVDKVIPSRLINGGTAKLPEYTHTAKDQADEWLSNQSDILNSFIFDTDNELQAIINWSILSIENVNQDGITSLALAPKPKKEKISEGQKMQLFAELTHKENPNFNEKLKNDFIATYQEIADKLKGISTEKQIHLVFAAMGVGYKAATVAIGGTLEFSDYMKNNRGKIDFSNMSAKDIRAQMEAEKSLPQIE